MTQKAVSGSRNVAIVGPYSSGKTTLLESLLSVSGAITRKGKISSGNTVGDASPEARNRQMTVEINAASTEYGGIRFTFLDCPGSVELQQETFNLLVGVDAAIVVCEPDPAKVLTLSPLFHFLDEWEIPHLVWLNKMDRASAAYGDVLDALRGVSSRPVAPQQYPIRQQHELLGFIDLVSEQAYHYNPGAPADPVILPESLKAQEQAAREEMLETLADFDDHLLEELLEDIEPPQEEILQDLKMELSSDLIVPVFLGSAQADYGVRPLLDALLREAPDSENTCAQRGLDCGHESETLVQVLKTYFTPQGGRLSLARVWQGELRDGDCLNGNRMGGLYTLMGQQQQSLIKAGPGSIVAIARLENARTGDTLTTADASPALELPRAERLTPVYALAIVPQKRSDEVKLTEALAKLMEEDPALRWEQH